jgi:hypothetical protein
VSPTTSSGVLARAAAVGVMSSVALVAAATASGAADATATAMDSPSPAGFAIFGMPVATTVWLLAGVLAVLVGLIGAARSARSGLGAPVRLLTAGVDDATFGSEGHATKGDAEGDRS